MINAPDKKIQFKHSRTPMKLFGRKRKEARIKKETLDLFNRIFPLNPSDKSQIQSRIQSILTEMFGEAQASSLLHTKEQYLEAETQFRSISIDSLGWKKIEEDVHRVEFANDFGGRLAVDIVQPQARLIEGVSEIEVYRNWIRNVYAGLGGGLIMCEEIKSPHEIFGYESIAKIPNQAGHGMDYNYFMNNMNYSEQKLYQITVSVKEMNPSGLRDNLLVHPISELAKVDLMKISEICRMDPYDINYRQGNLMNIMEREEFDELFPHNPLSIIRREIRPRMLIKTQFR